MRTIGRLSLVVLIGMAISLSACVSGALAGDPVVTPFVVRVGPPGFSGPVAADGDLIAWRDNDSIVAARVHQDGSVVIIPVSPSGYADLDISGDTIIWLDEWGVVKGSWIDPVRDVASRPVVLCNPYYYNASNAEIDGDTMVWVSGPTTISAGALTTGPDGLTLTPLPDPVGTSPYLLDWCRLDGDLVLWNDHRGFDAGTSLDIWGSRRTPQGWRQFPVCTDLGSQSVSGLSGDTVVWQAWKTSSTYPWGDDADVWGAVIDPATDGVTKFPLCTEAHDQLFPSLAGDLAIWTDDRSRYDFEWGTQASAPDVYGGVIDRSTAVPTVREFPIFTGPQYDWLQAVTYDAASGRYLAVWQSTNGYDYGDAIRAAWIDLEAPADVTGPVTSAARVFTRPDAPIILRYQVDDAAQRCRVRVVVRRPEGTVVRDMDLGWQPTGRPLSVTVEGALPRPPYKYFVYATDPSGNAQNELGWAMLLMPRSKHK